MKWNIIVGSLMLGATLSTPSFGGGLLDRMLGLKGSGCDSACCDTGCSADPSCGCELACEPSCGCESPCGDACGAAPTCGCEISACGDACGAAPTCGCEISACGDACGAAPSCGCEIAACDSGCGSKKKCGGLLSKLFKKRGNSCCDAMACDSGCASAPCGCSSAAPVAAPAVEGQAAPMPPAPVVDPSAYLQSNRRVIQATSYVR